MLPEFVCGEWVLTQVKTKSDGTTKARCCKKVLSRISWLGTLQLFSCCTRSMCNVYIYIFEFLKKLFDNKDGRKNFPCFHCGQRRLGCIQLQKYKRTFEAFWVILLPYSLFWRFTFGQKIAFLVSGKSSTPPKRWCFFSCTETQKKQLDSFIPNLFCSCGKGNSPPDDTTTAVLSSISGFRSCQKLTRFWSLFSSTWDCWLKSEIRSFYSGNIHLLRNSKNSAITLCIGCVFECRKLHLSDNSCSSLNCWSWNMQILLGWWRTIKAYEIIATCLVDVYKCFACLVSSNSWYNEQMLQILVQTWVKIRTCCESHFKILNHCSRVLVLAEFSWRESDTGCQSTRPLYNIPQRNHKQAMQWKDSKLAKLQMSL